MSQHFHIAEILLDCGQSGNTTILGVKFIKYQKGMVGNTLNNIIWISQSSLLDQGGYSNTIWSKTKGPLEQKFLFHWPSVLQMRDNRNGLQVYLSVWLLQTGWGIHHLFVFFFMSGSRVNSQACNEESVWKYCLYSAAAGQRSSTQACSALLVTCPSTRWHKLDTTSELLTALRSLFNFSLIPLITKKAIREVGQSLVQSMAGGWAHTLPGASVGLWLWCQLLEQ